MHTLVVKKSVLQFLKTSNNKHEIFKHEDKAIQVFVEKRIIKITV